MGRLSVLHLTREFPDAVTGGIEQSIAIAAASQAEVSHSVLCLGVHGQAMRSHVERVRVWRVKPSGSLKYFPLSLRWFVVFRRLVLSADIVHVHSPFPLGELTSLLATVPVLCTYHADIDGHRGLGRLYRPIQAWWLHRIQRVIATSDHYRATSPVLSKLNGTCEVIPFGLPATDQRPEAPPEDIPERFFLFLGSLRWYKGIEVLIEAARKSKLPIVIAGDGEQRHLLEPSPDPVYWLGQVSDAQRAWLLQHMLGLVLPSTSRAEAFGLVLLESMRASKPAICTRLGTATDWLVVDQQTGIVVDPGDADALASAMQRLWTSEALVETFGAAAFRRFESEFQSSRYADALYAVYQSMIR